jgi:hypothetical protein
MPAGGVAPDGGWRSTTRSPRPWGWTSSRSRLRRRAQAAGEPGRPPAGQRRSLALLSRSRSLHRSPSRSSRRPVLPRSPGRGRRRRHEPDGQTTSATSSSGLLHARALRRPPRPPPPPSWGHEHVGGRSRDDTAGVAAASAGRRGWSTRATRSTTSSSPRRRGVGEVRPAPPDHLHPRRSSRTGPSSSGQRALGLGHAALAAHLPDWHVTTAGTLVVRPTMSWRDGVGSRSCTTPQPAGDGCGPGPCCADRPARRTSTGSGAPTWGGVRTAPCGAWPGTSRTTTSLADRLRPSPVDWAREEVVARAG